MKQLAGLAEKAGWTFAQVFLSAWLAAGALGFDDVNGWLLSAAAAAGTVIANGLPEVALIPRPLDAVYRVARTFAVAFLAVLVTSQADGVEAALFAALPALLTAVKAEAARHIGGDTAATLPEGWDPGL